MSRVAVPPLIGVVARMLPELSTMDTLTAFDRLVVTLTISSFQPDGST